MKGAVEGVVFLMRCLVGVIGLGLLIAVLPALGYGDYISALICAPLGVLFIGVAFWGDGIYG